MLTKTAYDHLGQAWILCTGVASKFLSGSWLLLWGFMRCILNFAKVKALITIFFFKISDNVKSMTVN